MASSPTKRRKTRASVQSRVQAPPTLTPPQSDPPAWLDGVIPLEIFTQIATYLPRSTIQNMRLVNKEFESKVSAYLFQVVVVPFKPEIYDITPEPSLGDVRPTVNVEPKMILLQDKGMRVFQGFGGKIKKFAMSFEFDQDKLNNPPTKNTQEAITTFWGIYAWPYQRYNRYSQLEGLEQMADETKTMKEALRYITGANELGLSIDGGLGWLSGPDVNIHVLGRERKPIVFGNSKHAPEPKPTPLSPSRSTEFKSTSSQESQRYHELERMCKAAGYQGKYLDAAVQLMIKNEPAPSPPEESAEAQPALTDRQSTRVGARARVAAYTVTAPPANANEVQVTLGQLPANVNGTHQPTYVQPLANTNGSAVPAYVNGPTFNTNYAFQGFGHLNASAYPAHNHYGYLPFIAPANAGNAPPGLIVSFNPLAPVNGSNAYAGYANASATLNTANYSVPDPGDLVDVYDADDDEGEAGEAAESTGPRRIAPVTLGRQRQRYSRVEANYLKPADLTIAQKEMLLEIEWAQRAFMQSYTIAVIDNVDSFSGVKTLTIARLPYRHLAMLRREDFWDSLQSLEKLSLAIIPDWRDVAKHPAGWVQDVQLSASASVDGVFQLLEVHIADRENIKSLHLEWVGGGEYAVGMFSRNKHVMPAPLVLKAADMVNRKQVQRILKLPHLKHFSMKNCYVTPHILRRFVLGLKANGIKSIAFDSVSLTANIPLGTDPAPLSNPPAVAVAQVPPPAQLAAQFLQQMNQQMNQFANAGYPVALQVAAPIPLVAAPDPFAQPNWLEPPRPDSWASIVDVLTPRETIAEVRFARGFGYQPESSSPTSIKKLDFTSCGYVRLPLDFSQVLLNSPNPTFPDAAITKRMSDIEAHMVKPTDSLLGIIVNYMDPREVDALQNVFALTVGWSTRGNDRDELVADCEADGLMNAGRGRFDGIITADLTQ